MRTKSTVTTYAHDLKKWDEIADVKVDKNHTKRNVVLEVTLEHGSFCASFVRDNLHRYIERTLPRRWTHTITYTNWGV